MKPKTIPVFLLVLICLSGISSGQSFNAAKLDSLLDLLAEKNKAMGSLAMAENDHIVYAKAIGYQQLLPQKIASTEKTRYRIGSITKMFTATLVFQLIDEGQLELSTTLDTYFPTIPNAKKITIGNLLNHRSGIHSFTNDSAYLKWMDEPKTHDEMINIISSGKSEFNPGTKTAYSNSNFVLLGYIVEKITGQNYNDMLRARICLKIGLEDTYYGGKTTVANNECYSYRYITSWEKQPETDMSIPHGAGSIVSTSSDLVKFIHVLFNGQLVSEESLNHMRTITDGLGMGMQQFPYDGRNIYGHGGAIDGFNSILCYFPDEKLAVAYCSNGTVYAINDILIGALSIYFNKPYTLPVFTTYNVEPQDLNQYLGNYTSTQLPLKIAITKRDSVLYGQATGQPAFPLEPAAEHVFKFEMAGIMITFDPANQAFVLEQAGGKFHYSKEK